MNTKTVIFLTTLLFSTFTMQIVNAQDSDLTQAIKFRPTALIFGEIQLGYEFKISESSTIEIDGLYVSSKLDQNEYTGFGGALQYRYYFKKTPLKGWFVGPTGLYSTSKTSNDLKFSRTVVGLAIGYQWQLNPIVIDLFTGPGYYSFTADDPDVSIAISGFGPLVGFSVGVAF